MSKFTPSRELPTKEKILSIAKNNGQFVVNRNSYRADNLRQKLKRMCKDVDCPIKLSSVNQRELVFKLIKGKVDE